MNFKSLNTRIWLPSIAITVVFVLVSAVTAVHTSELAKQTQAKLLARLGSEERTMQWLNLSQANATRNVAIMLSADTALAGILKPEVDQSVAAISELQKQIDAAADTPEEKALLATASERRNEVMALRKQLVAAKAAGPLATPDIDHYRQLVADYATAQQAFASWQHHAVETTLAADIEARQRTVIMVVGVVMSLCGVLLGTAYLVMRSVLPPIREAVKSTERIAAGDLSVTVDTSRTDEIGELMRGLAHMTQSLSGLIAEVRGGAGNIQVASQEIATGNADLSNRTEQAASSLQETASSMEQLTGTVRQSADAAAQANQLAQSAATAAEHGGQVVGQVVANMDEIAGASRRIADIIGVIDGIAFQTNILALNAAVEAARAGEQGRGFAVVASEVRSLAQRSADAAKEIKTLIGASVEKVDSGNRLVRDAGESMTGIVASVRRLSDIVGEISAGTAEQRDGIGQVNTAVTHLDQMTQQNAALVEQSAAAAESLKQQAARLNEVVAAFTLAPGTRIAAAAPAPKAPAHEAAARGVIRNAQQAARTAPAPMPAARPDASSAASDWESF